MQVPESWPQHSPWGSERQFAANRVRAASRAVILFVRPMCNHCPSNQTSMRFDHPRKAEQQSVDGRAIHWGQRRSRTKAVEILACQHHPVGESQSSVLGAFSGQHTQTARPLRSNWGSMTPGTSHLSARPFRLERKRSGCQLAQAEVGQRLIQSRVCLSENTECSESIC